MTSSNVPKQVHQVTTAAGKFPLECRVRLNDLGREESQAKTKNRCGTVTGHGRMKKFFDPFTVLVLWDEQQKPKSISARFLVRV